MDDRPAFMVGLFVVSSIWIGLLLLADIRSLNGLGQNLTTFHNWARLHVKVRAIAWRIPGHDYGLLLTLRGEIKMSAKINFTQDEMSKMRDLYESGLSIPKIAKMFGVSYGTMWNRLNDTGVEMRKTSKGYRKSTQDEMSKMRDLYEFGLSSNDIAKMFGVSPETVRNYLREMGVEMRPYSPETIRNYLREMGMS